MPALLRLALLLAAAVAATSATPRIRRQAQVQQQQQQQQQQQKLQQGGGGGGADPSIDYGDYVREHGARAGQPGFTYPACSIQESLNSDGMICAAGSGWLALTQLVPPQLGTGSTVEAPLDPKGDLPRPLQAVAKPLPAQIPAAVVEQEKPTYYFAYRAIQNLYGAMGTWPASPSDDQILDLKLPAAWVEGKAYRVDGTALTGDAPLAVSYSKGDQMLVVIRGTVYAREWQRDFQYAWAKAKDSQTLWGLPGRVHYGFFAVFRELAGPVDGEIQKHRPKRLTVTGHSLGGAVGALLAYYFAARYPDTSVELISFGAPNVGDKGFTAEFDKKVNNRHLTFTGPGTDGASYYIGDWIAQSPCGPVNTCPLLTQMSDTDAPGNATVTISSATMENDAASFSYAALGGAVDFSARDLPNAETWALRSDVTSLRYSPVASHVCSYACFLASAVGDPRDLCVFTLEWNNDVAMENRCQINY